jgi:galactitol-specific phosphotransferase system IIB component
MENKKEIKYKHSESNRNYSKKLISNINIQSEDDLLSKLEQLKSENKYEECISLIEQQLPYLEKNYSKESEKFYQLAYEITDICNLKAYDLFLNSKPEEGRKFIEKSIQIFSNYKQILNICYANLGKYYVKLNQRQKAIDCFIVSTEIARSLKNKLHVAQGHLLLANILLNSSSINQAIEQALSGIILLQEIIINKEEYKDNLNILEALEDAYLIVAVGKYKSGNIIQSLLYCNLAEKIQEKIGKFNKKDESNEKSNLDKKSKKSKKSKNNTSELNILEDDTKYELIKNALSFDVYQDKALFDKNEQMSYNYLINTLKKMLTEIEIKLKSKKTEGNENEFFISQMNGENNNITYYSNMDEVNK